MTIATTEPLMVATAQPTATPAKQPAAPAQMPSKKTQLPRFNHRCMTNFEDRQIENIQALKRKSGGTENSVVRSAVDLLAYVNGLPVESDPSIFINNFLVLANNPQSGGSNGR